MTTLLVDGDILVYQAAFSAETTVSFGDDDWASSANLGSAKEHFTASLAHLQELTQATATIIAISDKANWRKTLCPTYKLQRTKTRRPVLLKPLQEWVSTLTDVKTKTLVFIRPTLEADDVLGILGTTKVIVKGPRVIASIDKDLLQIPGDHINITSSKTRTVTEEEGDLLHMMQTLTGDPVDNYPGLPGCGPVKAAKHLSDPAVPWWPSVVKAYEKKGLTEEDALLQARLARICRASDYDFKTKEVKLWLPPT